MSPRNGPDRGRTLRGERLEKGAGMDKKLIALGLVAVLAVPTAAILQVVAQEMMDEK